MSEKPSDGTVSMHYGDIDEGDFVAAEDHLPTLPNTVSLLRVNFFWVIYKDLHMKLVECILLQLFEVLFTFFLISFVNPFKTFISYLY